MDTRRQLWSQLECDKASNETCETSGMTQPSEIPTWLATTSGCQSMTSDTTGTDCPHCHWEAETIWHFLECQHPSQQTLFCKLQQQLQKLHQRFCIDLHLFQLLWHGLSSIWQQYSLDKQLDSYPNVFQTLFHDQRCLGWEQLYYGWIASSWSYYIDHHSQYKVNGTIFYSQVTETIGGIFLKFGPFGTQHYILHNTQPRYFNPLNPKSTRSLKWLPMTLLSMTMLHS